MKAHLSEFKSGWHGLSLELSVNEIDHLIRVLKTLKGGAAHFHFRSDFTGEPRVGDIEFSCCGTTNHRDLVLDETSPEYTGGGMHE